MEIILSLLVPVGVVPGGILSALLLITLLALKELANATLERKWLAFGRFLNIALMPLLMIFFITVAIGISNALR